ncbi:MAG: OB-fold nucleic acid binding domain-containing protein [Paludibacteraceae bacterium]|nr:OB-fold nucleic acid binding domain-containing protein [Paludibacteraceae bacterium]
MKKILSLVSAIALALPIFAGTVTFKPGDFDGQGTSSTGSEVTATKGGVTLTCDKGYGSTSALRCYKNGVLTITSETKISTLDFSFETANGKTYTGDLEAQITVNDKSWTNTLTNQARFTEIVVTIEGEGVEPERVDTFSVSQVLTRFAEGKKGECYVKGKVTSIITNNVETYGNISYWLADVDNPTDTVQGYRMKAAGNQNYASAADVEFVEGDEILVYAAGVSEYKKDESTPAIIELNTGYYVRTLKGAEIVNLDWAIGSAYLATDGWSLEIAKAIGDEKNIVTINIKSSKKDAIAGSYQVAASSTLMQNGSKTDITTGQIILKFKEIGPNSLNIYTAQATFSAGDKVYRLKNDVEFYAADNDGNEIVLTGDRPFKPTEGQEITCAQAQEYAFSLASGATGEISVSVVGYVTSVVDASTFWMDDQTGSKKTFEAYKFKTLEPAGKAIAEGAKVKVTGYVTNYNGTTAEIKDGAVEILSGGEEVKTIKATVAEAITAAETLANNAVTTDLYEITAFIADVAYAYSADFGNISLWLTDTEGSNEQVFQAYRAKCDASIAEQLVAGTKVVVTGNLKKQYDAEKTEDDGTVKPERTILEIVNGKVVLYGTAVDNINADVQAVKFIQNGQIYILRNGVRYNLQGQIAD